MKVMITGGAGFIGLHLAQRALSAGCDVTLLDNLNEQVHGRRRPDIPVGANLVVNDVRQRNALVPLFSDVEILVHFAAETGTGQSMYSPARYESVNIGGTAVILDLLVNRAAPRIRKVVVASSRAVYGEGKYRCAIHGAVYPASRSLKEIQKGQFEPLCPQCARPCSAVATDEDSPLKPLSFYGLSKQVQEQMFLLFAETLGFSAIALRYQNVYGPGQSLINPYTGILSIFSKLARAGDAIHVFEDGQESRDFVYIDDAVEATWQAMQFNVDGIHAINVGSGQRTTVKDVAHEVASFFESPSEIVVTGNFRAGDIRHNFADLSRAQALLGYRPKTSFSDGLDRFLHWVQAQQIDTDASFESSLEELRTHGLLSGSQTGGG